MNQDKPEISLMEVARTTRYPVAAFHFLRRGLDYTVHRLHEHPERLTEAERHISGSQLCEGLRDFAVEQYGLLAQSILNRWNIHRTEDFGQIVYAMVESGLMQATGTDSIRDFDNGFDFDEAFKSDIPVDDVPLEDAYADESSHG